MTTPGGTSGFEYGADNVTASFNVDVPAEGVQTLHQLAKETENLRVQMEALARAEGSHIEMVQQMAELHNQVANSTRGLTDEIGRLATNNQQAARGGQGLSETFWGAPSGTFLDPFAGVTAGITRGDVASAMGGMDPRTVMNMQAQRGNLSGEDLVGISQESINQLAQEMAAGVKQGMADEMRRMGIGGEGGGTGGGGSKGRQPGSGRRGKKGAASDDDRDISERVDHLTDSAENLTNQLLNELSPGGSTGRGLTNILQTLGGSGEGAMGRILGAAGKVGPVGAALGVGLAANSLIQAGGQQLQEYQNMGSIKGGGMGEGISMEMSARAMAMNPFITTEQSRQIMQSALSEGYSGKTFDTVTQFMANNLREMNMSVAESTKLLQTNVASTGEGIGELTASLGALKENSKTGVSSFEDLKQAFSNLSEMLSNAGFNQGTNALAGTLANAFPNNKVLSDNQTTQKLAAGFLGNPDSPGFASMMNSLGLGGMEPDAAANAMGQMDSGKVTDAMFNQFRAVGATTAYQIRKYAESFGVQLTSNEAQALAEEMRKGPGAGREAAEKFAAPAKATNGRSFLSRVWDSTRETIGAANEFVIGATMLPGSARDKRFEAAQDKWTRAQAEGAEYSSPTLNSLAEAYGQRGFEVLDENGNPLSLNQLYGTGGAASRQAIEQGKYRWRPTGTNESRSFEQAQGVTRENKTEVFGAVNVNITAPPGFSVQGGSTQRVQISSNTRKAQAGWGPNTVNNPPPGG